MKTYVICMYVFSIFMGVHFDFIQREIGMKSLNEGVLYYAEVHRSLWNSVIHTIFMPFTILGMNLWIPSMFELSVYNAKHLRFSVGIFYIIHYVKMNVWITFLTSLLYWNSISVANEYHQLYTDKAFSTGLSVSLIALFAQEILGHYLGGDDASRTEAIPNAIMYAMYYSVSHFFN